jgi:hypothetical protein
LRVTGVSSTISWSKAVTREAVSSFRSATTWATLRGWAKGQ